MNKRITIWKSELDLLKRDIEDVENWHLYIRCLVCGHLILEGWCCLICGWNGEKCDIEEYKKKYQNED